MLRGSNRKPTGTLTTDSFGKRLSTAFQRTNAGSMMLWVPFLKSATTFGSPISSSLGSQMVIPATLRKDDLCQLHASHQGQDRTLRRAQQVVYWPSITNDIRNVGGSCAECAERFPNHAPEPLLIDPPPSRPLRAHRSRFISAWWKAVSRLHQSILRLAYRQYLRAYSYVTAGHQPSERVDGGREHPGAAGYGRWPPVYLAGDQAVLRRLGNQPHGQQSPPLSIAL